MNIYIAALLHQASAQIEAFEARLLLCAATGLTRTQLIAYPETVLDEAQASQFLALAQRRAAGEPIAYLLGEREFYGRSFIVSPAVLIPRPETELLVDLALPRVCGNVLDLGTGSGALAVTLAAELAQAKSPHSRYAVTATDISVDALAIARANAERHGVAVHLLESDWYQALAGQRFAVIISNPPYIAADDAHLSSGDLRFEPCGALTDGADGLSALRIIIAGAPQHLHPDGWLLLEHGYDQAAAVRALLETAGFVDVQSWRDIAGIERASGGCRKHALSA